VPAAASTGTDNRAGAVDARSAEPLFNLDDTRLLGIGVPESMVEPVAALRTQPELIAMEPRLPIEAYEALMLIRALVPEGQNDLFFVGDGHQRIYRRRAVMGRCGIRIVGRALKLKINYRTTEQIRRFASAVLDGQRIDDLDGGEDCSTDYLSLTHGPDATLAGFDDEAAEIRWIVEHVRALADDDGSLAHCCVLLRTRELRDRYARAIAETGLELVMLDARADDQTVPGIRVANMHRVKGLEFRHVVIAAMNHGIVPNRLAVGGSDDLTELRDRELAERALLHVCASRAIETLAVTWNGAASEYLAR